MTHALGPVVGNALLIKPDEPKQNLRERLATLRYTSAGVMSEDGGKLSFAPNYAGECPVSMPAVYRGPAYVPKTDFGVAIEQAATASFKAEAFDPKTSPLRVGDRVKQVRSSFINHNHYAMVERIEDGFAHVKWEDPAATPGFPWGLDSYRNCFEIVSRGDAQPAFDPMTEPLALGDYVEVVYQEMGCVDTGKRGHVTQLKSAQGYEMVRLKHDDGTETTGEGGWGCRSSLKLIRKAAA